MNLTNTLFLAGAIAMGPQITSVGTDAHRQAPASTRQDPSTSLSSSHAAQKTPVRLSKLMAADFRSRDGQSLGKLQDIVIDPATGKITFAVLGSGAGERHIPVPWQALNVSPDQQFTLNISSDALKSAPTLGDDYLTRLYDPAYTVTIHEFYSVPMGAADLRNGLQTGRDYNREAWESDQDTSDDLEDPPFAGRGERGFDESVESDFDTSDDL